MRLSSRDIRRFSVAPCFRTLVLGLVAAVVGCSDGGKNEPSVPELPSDPLYNMTIDVAVPQGLGLRENWQLILDEWTAQTGVSVTMHEYDAADDHEPLTQLLAVDESRKRLPLLFVVPVNRVAELAVEGAVATIPTDQQQANDLNWSDVFEGLRTGAGQVGRNDLFVPVSNPVLVCYYRRDLLEKAGLSPPQTWAEYQTLIDNLPNWAPGMSAVEPWGEDYRATTFLARAAAFAKHPANVSFTFDVNTGEPLIDQPGFVRALETAKAAISKMPNEVLSYAPLDCRRELLSGRAAIGIALEPGPNNAPPPFGPEQESAATNANKESADTPTQSEPVDLECVRLPGSPEVYNKSLGEWETPPGNTNYAAMTGFSGLSIGVSSKSNHQEKVAAWNLIGALTVGNMETAFPLPLRSVCRISQVPDGPRWLNDELSPATASSYVGAVEASLSDTGLARDLPVVERSKFSAALTEELTKCLSDKQAPIDAKTALGNVAKRWRETTQEIGLTRLHNSYRGALGIPVRVDDPTE